MLAVLETRCTSISSVVTRRREARRLFDETEQWFASEDTTSPFSFVTICGVFGLVPTTCALRSSPMAHVVRADRPTSDAMPLRIRHVSGSRHR